MRLVFEVFLLVHAFAHVVVFLAYWNVLKHEEISSKTEILEGRFDIGPERARMLGFVWLLVGLAFAIVALRMMMGHEGYFVSLLVITLFSLLLTITGLPDTKIGVLLNTFLVPFLIMNYLLEWI